MFKRIIFIFICLFLSAVSAISDDRPVVLALTAIPRSGMRERIVAELVQNYNCFVLNRLRGYDFVLENSIADILSLDKIVGKSSSLPAADYVVGVEIDDYGTSESKAAVLWVEDLRSAIPREQPLSKRFEDKGTSSTELEITKAIVELLSLKKISDSPSTNQNEYTWAVLPVARWDLGDKWAFGLPDPDSVSMYIEAAIQKSTIGLLVDRTQIDDVLKELKIKQINEITAGVVGRLVKADILVLGQLSRIDQHLRMDLLFVESKTAAVVGALTLSPWDVSKLAISIEKDIPAFLRSVNIYTMPLSNAMQRKREADVYLNFREKGNVYFDHVLRHFNHSEAAYLLLKDDEKELDKLVARLFEVVVYSTTGREQLPLNSKWKKMALRAHSMIEELLKDAECDIGYAIPSPLLIRAETSLAVLDYDQAMKLAQKYLQGDAKKDEKRALYILMKANYDTKNIAKAVEISEVMKKAYGNNLTTWNPVWGTCTRISSLLSSLENISLAKNASKEQMFLKLRERFKDRSYGIKIPEWTNYIALLKEFRTTEEVIKELELWVRYSDYNRDKLGLGASLGHLPRMHGMLDLADCYLKTGDKQKATVLLREVSRTRIPWGMKPYKAKAEKKLAGIAADTGDIHDGWKKAYEVRKIPDNYSIYLAPVGDIDEAVIREYSAAASDFLGVAPKILPAIPVPESAIAEDSTILLVEPLWRDIIRTSSIPDDALYLVYLTKERVAEQVARGKGSAIGRYASKACFSKAQGNPVLLSAHAIQLNISRVAPSDCAVRLLSSFRYTYTEKKASASDYFSKYPHGAKECNYFPCLYFLAPHYSHSTLLVEICEECQNEYKNVDFDRMHTDLISYLKTMDAKIITSKNTK